MYCIALYCLRNEPEYLNTRLEFWCISPMWQIILRKDNFDKFETPGCDLMYFILEFCVTRGLSSWLNVESIKLWCDGFFSYDRVCVLV